MRSITTLDIQYAHRFYGFKGEAQYLHRVTQQMTERILFVISSWEVMPMHMKSKKEYSLQQHK